MKKVSSIIDVVKMLLKYSAYVIVAVDVLSYALRKFQELQEKEDKKNPRFVAPEMEASKPIEVQETEIKDE